MRVDIAAIVDLATKGELPGRKIGEGWRFSRAALPERDRFVLHLRFVEDLTQAEIADRVGVSQMHVSRLIRRALERLRTVADHAG